MVGVMGGGGGKGEPGLLDPLPRAPGWECAVGVGTPGSYFWFGDGALSGGWQFLWHEPPSISIWCIWKALGAGRNSSACARAVGTPSGNQHRPVRTRAPCGWEHGEMHLSSPGWPPRAGMVAPGYLSWRSPKTPKAGARCPRSTKGLTEQSLSVRSQTAPDPSDLELAATRGETNLMGATKMAGKCLAMGLDGTWLLRERAHALDAL